MSGIAVVVSGFPRRSETFLLHELRALDERGLLDGVYATKAGESDIAHPDATHLRERVTYLGPGPAAAQASELAARLATRPPRALHGYFAHVPAEVAEAASALLGRPFGFSVHAKDARKIAPVELGRRAGRAACVVACNSDVATTVAQSGGHARLLPHGVDLDRFRPHALDANGTPRLLAVGRLVEKKGFAVLIDALAGMAASCRLRVAGDGPLRAQLERRAAGSGVADRIEWLGACDHARVAEEYARADIVVVPSIVDREGDRDGLPNVVLEALASGCPIVASSVAAIGDAIDDDVEGLLVPPGSASTLAAALDRLCARPFLRRRLGEAGRRRAERCYSLDACTGRFCDALEESYA